MKNRQLGFTYIELMGALLVASMMVFGFSAMVTTSLADTKAQQAAQQQSQAAAAATKFIASQYAALLTATGGGATKAIPFTGAVAAGMTQPMTDFWPANFGNNAYNQSFCLLVRQRPPLPSNKLDALVITEGGVAGAISGINLPYIASNGGQGAGYISNAIPNTAGLAAIGAYGTWQLSAANLANFSSANCGTAMSTGHLATALFYEGPGQYTTDFLYRNAVPNRPDLNTMTTPIAMGAGSAAQVTEDAACPAPILPGSLAVSNAMSADGVGGRVLTCRSGTWQRQGNLFWRNPVTQYSDLANLNNPVQRAALDPRDPRPNVAGDVRMVTTPPTLLTGRANTATAQPPLLFTWDGSLWQGLTANQYGVLTTPEIQISRNNVVKGGSCDTGSPAGAPAVPIGRLATDTNGLLLSCQYKDATTNIWGTQSTMELAWAWPAQTAIILWNSTIIGIPWDSPTPTNTYYIAASRLEYIVSENWYKFTEIQTIKPTRNGLIVANATTNMARELEGSSGLLAQFQIQTRLYDLDFSPPKLIADAGTMPSTLRDSSGLASVSLSKAVVPNTNGYEMRIITGWSTYGTGPGQYYRANYRNAGGSLVEQTPLFTTWSMDLFY